MDDETKYRIEANEHNLARTIGFVGIIDTKATFVLSLVLALTAYFVAQLGPFLNAHVQHQKPNPWEPVFFVLLDLVATACLTCFLIDAIIIIHIIKPRTGQHTGKASLLFYGTIATMPCEDFKKQMGSISPNEYADLLIDQTFDNAKILHQKTKDSPAQRERILLGARLLLPLHHRAPHLHQPPRAMNESNRREGRTDALVVRAPTGAHPACATTATAPSGVKGATQ